MFIFVYHIMLNSFRQRANQSDSSFDPKLLLNLSWHEDISNIIRTMSSRG